jgi:hypothetical protein
MHQSAHSSGVRLVRMKHRVPHALIICSPGCSQSFGSGAARPAFAWAIEFCCVSETAAEWQEATARCANRRLPVSFKALIRRGSPIGGHARQQMIPLASDLLPFPGQMLQVLLTGTVRNLMGQLHHPSAHFRA